MRSVVITGASTGIGYATATLLASQGIHVFGSVRQEADAERLQKELGEHFTPLFFDVTDESKIKQAALQVEQKLQGHTLWGLINNAGIAVTGPLLTLPIQHFQKQLDVNLTGQLMVTQAFAPLLGADTSRSGKPGKIINISSVAGKNAYPFSGPYSVSKHGLEAFSEALRRELMLFGIDVIIVAPGVIKTPIWEKAKQKVTPAEVVASVYGKPIQAFREYMMSIVPHGLPASVVANLILHILQSKHPKTRYAPVPQKLLNWTLPNLLPKRWMDWIVAKKFGLLPIKK